MVIAIIPARFNSSRFPGKPLALINGRPMILHVLNQARKIKGVDVLLVATDSDLIADVVKDSGGVVAMTGEHNSGTDRVAEVVNGYADDAIVLNIQGDLPFVNADVCEQLIKYLNNTPLADVATPVIAQGKKEEKDYLNPNTVKAVFDINNKALYFSRRPIPDSGHFPYGHLPVWYRHIGVYAYRNAVLQRFSQLPQTELEKAERLEQLRMLHYGFNIRCVPVTSDCGPDINCPSDLKWLSR